MVNRSAIVAGRFYPKGKDELLKELSALVRKDVEVHNDVLAVIAPHAGYMYSGKTAGLVYSSIKIPNTAIILSPNHTGLGYPISIDPSEKWETPLGWVEADLEFIEKLKKELKEVELDTKAQQREHALEVQLPFIKYINPTTKIVPITVAGLPFPIIQKLGKSIAKLLLEQEAKTGVRPLIIASSDMTHFESAEAAKKKDMVAIDKIKELDSLGFVSMIEEQNISICGLYTISTVIEAVLEYTKHKANKPKVELLEYTNSGVVTGDLNEVVAYAGLLITA